MHKNETQRVSLLLDSELIRKADQAQELAGVSSRNQFVGKAIEHYLAELTAKDNSNALTELLSSAIEKATENTYSKVSSALFRYAVFVDMMMRIVGEQFEITPEEWKERERESYNNVRRTRGKISIDEALKHSYIPYEQNNAEDIWD